MFSEVYILIRNTSSYISNNGREFISDEFQDNFHRLNILNIKIVPYHQQSNLAERVNRTLNQMTAW